ncbi:GtrA family protein [Mucilaginibacter sp.]|jgi:putative flippase GtrA|uniref:GtrA family protein n=1 Tax=Mucilaginibacter sp. TaxID=1882438 RepID=UPI0039C9332D
MVNSKLAKKLARNQVLRFVFSAGLGFLVDISAFYLLFHNLLTQPTYKIFSFTFRNFTVSLAISFFLGVVVNFLITRYMVFNESTSKPSKQFFRFVLVAVVGFFANWGVVKLLVEIVGMYPPIARPLAALSLFFASYFIHKAFSFSLSLRHHAS